MKATRRLKRLISSVQRSLLITVTGLLCLSIFLLAGCPGTGPSSVARDRFDYVTSVSESWKRQMLINLLKIRYTDAPVFMDVASVINSYELAGEVNLFGQLARVNSGDQIAGVGVTGRYADKPTITYQPLAGDKFTRSMMLPIPIPAILHLIQSGYPADLVLRICVNSINDMQNSYGGAGRPQAGDTKFRELIAAIRESQNAGGLGMKMKSSTDRQAVVMFLRQSQDEAIAAPVRRIRELLGLSETDRELSIIYGTYPESRGEVAILSRSILQVLTDFASHIEVPQADLVEERVYGHEATPEQEQLFPHLLAVHSGSLAPADAFVSVHYRNQWFWIEDRDRQSKAVFNFLMFLFSLTETGATQAAPIMTVPAR